MGVGERECGGGGGVRGGGDEVDTIEKFLLYKKNIS